MKVNGRTLGDGLLLAETKGDHLLNSSDTLDKVLASHQLYKRPVMLMQEDGGRFMTIQQDNNGKNVPDQIFRLDLMVGYLTKAHLVSYRNGIMHHFRFILPILARKCSWRFGL